MRWRCYLYDLWLLQRLLLAQLLPGLLCWLLSRLHKLNDHRLLLLSLCWVNRLCVILKTLLWRHRWLLKGERSRH